MRMLVCAVLYKVVLLCKICIVISYLWQMIYIVQFILAILYHISFILPLFFFNQIYLDITSLHFCTEFIFINCIYRFLLSISAIHNVELFQCRQKHIMCCYNIEENILFITGILVLMNYLLNCVCACNANLFRILLHVHN